MRISIFDCKAATLLAVILLLLSAGHVAAQTTAFSHEGRLDDGGSPANGAYDFEFKLFDTLTAGTQQGATLQQLNVTVTNGAYVVTLDFGAAVFTGADRFLEVSYRPAGGAGSFTTLSPRQQILSVPYAIRSLTAASAEGLSVNCVNCVTSAQIAGVNGSAVTGTIPVASVPAGSSQYIQNTTSQQSPGNFNISGNGTVGGTLSASIVNSSTSYNLFGSPVLRSSGASLLVGVNAGGSQPNGSYNAIFGNDAGAANTGGAYNSFFGGEAGKANTEGHSNAFFGYVAGSSNTVGSENSFFGFVAGRYNTTGARNTFVGGSAGGSNTTGHDNAFFGSGAGGRNTAGNNNAFFGVHAGLLNTGNDNAFFGIYAGVENTGNNNAFFGNSAGYKNMGNDNAFFGTGAGLNNRAGIKNVFFGAGAGNQNREGSANTFLGYNAGNTNTTGLFNTVVGQNADVTAGNLTYATAIGAGAAVSNNSTVVLGRSSDTVRVPGNLWVATLGSAGSTQLCRNGSNLIATCSSSLRYKTDVRPYTGGLDIIKRLRPIAFNWKEGGLRDVGFGAEDVSQVEPLLTTHNEKGELEGVKYAQVTTVLVNAINEQQRTIELQQQQLKQQQTQIEQHRVLLKQHQDLVDALRKAVCDRNSSLAVCK
jgi:trimeric autotransporter adhesin